LKLKLDYKWVALTVTTVGSFMASLDTSIVVIGLPTILKEIGGNITDGVWIITGYRVAMTLLLVLFGKLADVYGRVRLYNIGFAVFTVGSLFCGFSTTGTQLVLSRILQGVGAALLYANSAAIITDAFPPTELGMGLGTNMMATNLGYIAGYSISGPMISLWGWRSMFLINIPIGIIATFWGYIRLKDTSVRLKSFKFDYIGSVLYSLALLVVLYAMTVGKSVSTQNLIMLAAGLALFLVVIIVELKVKNPLLDLSLFKIRLFAAGNITSLLDSLAYNCGPYLRSFYLQLVMGYSATESGAMMIPLNAVIFFISPISGRLSDRFGSQILSSVGLVLMAASFFWFATLGLILFGLGRAVFTSPNSSSIMGSVPADKRGVANGVRMTINQTGNVLSVPFSILLMTLMMPYDRLALLLGSETNLAYDDLTSFLKSINFACLILGVILLVAVIPSFLRGPKMVTTKATETTKTAKETD
jgi:EmrB/QacA subfamily drug resistance transporter